MRWQAQHLLTEELGPRPEHVIEQQLDREIGQERLTSVDRKLAAVLAPDQSTDVARMAAKTGDSERRRLVGRLQKLETLQLAVRTTRGSWQLTPEWQAALRELGERGDIIKRIHRAMGPDGDPARYEVVDASVDRAPIEGVVRRKGLHDELRGDAYAVVETPRGKAAYVRLDATTAETLVEGSVVRITVEPQKWSKPTDPRARSRGPRERRRVRRQGAPRGAAATTDRNRGPDHRGGGGCRGQRAPPDQTGAGTTSSRGSKRAAGACRRTSSRR